MSDCSKNAFKLPEIPATFEDAVVKHLWYMQTEMEAMADRMDELEQRMAQVEKKRRKQSKYFSNRIFELYRSIKGGGLNV